MDVLINVLEYIALAIGIIALLIIICGVVRGLIEVARLEFSKKRQDEEFVGLGRARYHIGYHLLLGLEFLIAADIIRTIVKPTLEELAILGTIVIIRIVIGYFLGKEIEQFRKRDKELP